MKTYIETERLIIRELTYQDIDGMFKLDSNPKVHTYLGNNIIKTKEEAKKNIDFIKLQYSKNGIGRWAIIEKESGDFIGWTGFKLITNLINKKSYYYDLGYRLIQESWGKGYATESAIACLNYGFNKLNKKDIFAMADIENAASNTILKKIGMSKINEFNYNNVIHNFYQITESE